MYFHTKCFRFLNAVCYQPPFKPKLVRYAMKLDLVSLARLAGLRVVRYKIVAYK